MKILTIVLSVVVAVGAAGCGGGSSAVQEYNAAQESYDREFAALQEIEESIKNTSDEKLRSELKAKREKKLGTLEKLRIRARSAESQL